MFLACMACILRTRSHPPQKTLVLRDSREWTNWPRKRRLSPKSKFAGMTDGATSPRHQYVPAQPSSASVSKLSSSLSSVALTMDGLFGSWSHAWGGPCWGRPGLGGLQTQRKEDRTSHMKMDIRNTSFPLVSKHMPHTECVASLS